jgi:cytoskeletal protein RodZ
MESVGELFKQAREAQGMNLEEVASLTRIQQQFLQALEEEDFAKLPEHVFTKGFVRTYARSLGIDEDEALRRFSETAGSFYEKDEEDRRQFQKRVEDDRKGKLNRNLVMIITGAVLIGLIYLLPREQSGPLVPDRSGPASVPAPSVPTEDISSGEGGVSLGEPLNSGNVSVSDDDASPPQPDSSVNQKQKPEKVASLKEDSSPRQPKEISSRGEDSSDSPRVGTLPTSEQTTLASQDLLLELEAMEMTWIVVRSDEGEPHEALLQPGETATWKASERFYLTLGNAGGVSVKLNGEPRGPFGKPGVVIRDLEITP